MSADVTDTVRAMMRLYSLLHPSLRSDRSVSWEMDRDTIDVLKRQARNLSVFDVDPYRDGVELQCFGIRVVEADRPGVRLVIEATTR